MDILIHFLKILAMRTQSIWKTITLLALPGILFFTACDPNAIKGEGDILTENRGEKDFKSLQISVPGEIHITQGQNFSLKVTAEETLLPYLETEVKNGYLHVYFSHSVRNVDDLEIEITMPELKNVEMSGSGKLHTHGDFSGGTMNLNLSGSGEMKLANLDVAYIAANVSGSGSIHLKGAAEELDTHVSGSGEVNAFQCPVEAAEAHVSGSGVAKVQVSDKLIAHISGSGHIEYMGDPVVEKHISGSGSVIKK